MTEAQHTETAEYGVRTAADPASASDKVSYTPGNSGQFISFAIGDEYYCVDIMSVREIKGWSDVTSLPNQPEFVRGVLNLRGVVVPIFDLRTKFGQGRTEVTRTHVIIIIHIEGRMVGLLVDRVSDILTFELKRIQPVPETSKDRQSDFLSGLVTMDDQMIALLDLSTLVKGVAAL